MKCDFCNEDIGGGDSYTYETGGNKRIKSMTLPIPFTCRECGGTFCPKHRLPEYHNCTYEPTLKSTTNTKIETIYTKVTEIDPIILKEQELKQKQLEQELYPDYTSYKNESKQNKNQLIMFIILIVIVLLILLFLL